MPDPTPATGSVPAAGTQTPPTDEQPAWAKNLETSLQQTADGIRSLVDLAKASSTRSQQPPPVVEPEEVDDGEDILDSNNLELLPRRTFAAKLLESMEKTVTKALKPLQDGIAQANNTALSSHYMNEAEKFAGKTPDFAEWADEMSAIAKEQPTLTISRIYHLARAENPTKHAEMLAKYPPGGTKPATEAKPKPAAAKPKPLAISPASNSSTVTDKRMTQEEASRSAWDESVAKFGNILE